MPTKWEHISVIHWESILFHWRFIFLLLLFFLLLCCCSLFLSPSLFLMAIWRTKESKQAKWNGIFCSYTLKFAPATHVNVQICNRIIHLQKEKRSSERTSDQTSERNGVIERNVDTCTNSTHNSNVQIELNYGNYCYVKEFYPIFSAIRDFSLLIFLFFVLMQHNFLWVSFSFFVLYISFHFLSVQFTFSSIVLSLTFFFVLLLYPFQRKKFCISWNSSSLSLTSKWNWIPQQVGM